MRTDSGSDSGFGVSSAERETSAPFRSDGISRAARMRFRIAPEFPLFSQ